MIHLPTKASARSPHLHLHALARLKRVLPTSEKIQIRKTDLYLWACDPRFKFRTHACRFYRNCNMFNNIIVMAEASSSVGTTKYRLQIICPNRMQKEKLQQYLSIQIVVVLKTNRFIYVPGSLLTTPFSYNSTKRRSRKSKKRMQGRQIHQVKSSSLSMGHIQIGEGKEQWKRTKDEVARRSPKTAQSIKTISNPSKISATVSINQVCGADK